MHCPLLQHPVGQVAALQPLAVPVHTKFEHSWPLLRQLSQTAPPVPQKSRVWFSGLVMHCPLLQQPVAQFSVSHPEFEPPPV